MQSVSTEKYTYYQYAKEQALPVYIRLRVAEFDPEIAGFLQIMNFTELGEKESELAQQNLASNQLAKVMTIDEATPMVAAQIRSNFDNDKYGKESIVQKPGYNVYRYKNMAMIVLSLASNEWLMGTFPELGHTEREFESRVVINRFLTWALAPMGIIGLWGRKTKQGIILGRMAEVKGEVIYIDYRNQNIFTMSEVHKLRKSEIFIKQDALHKIGPVKMRFEDAQAFLAIHSAYFGANGMPMATRQAVATLAKNIMSYKFAVNDIAKELS
ncbi:hypothetical protein ABMA79_00180 [Halobacteriovorax sp. HFRX-2_2]|uniref:hypothetical protein n=1 Tax=unclassified Halobacteriovorax TaxID=2639665 RepID=UPI003710B76F